jgi:hypothetical protein
MIIPFCNFHNRFSRRKALKFALLGLSSRINIIAKQTKDYPISLKAHEKTITSIYKAK